MQTLWSGTQHSTFTCPNIFPFACWHISSNKPPCPVDSACNGYSVSSERRPSATALAEMQVPVKTAERLPASPSMEDWNADPYGNDQNPIRRSNRHHLE
jgi:hypothetical protein